MFKEPFSFFGITGWGIDLDYCDIEWFALKTNEIILSFLRLYSSTTFWTLEGKLKAEGKRKDIHTHLNGEFQRTARREKKVFLSDRCKEIEENNRRGKTRGLFKKIRDTKGTLHAKMSSIKDRNVMDLTEADDIKKRCQE